ncbi:hypothetical protein FCV76_03660 [Vibrio sp. F13]|nr:hypothetical protein FCV76_03660 [Vibrio sp. F13]
MLEDIRELSPPTPPSVSTSQRMWCVWWLSQNVHSFSNVAIEILLDNVSVPATWNDVMDRIIPENGIADNQKKFFRPVFMALVTNAALKKVVKLPVHLRWEAEVVQEIKVLTPLSSCFSKLALEVMAESSETRCEIFKCYFEPKLNGLKIKPRSMSANSNLIARYMFTRGIESFEEMTVDSFVDFRIECYIDRPKTDIPWRIFCEAYEHNGFLPKGWVDECVEKYAQLKSLSVAKVNIDRGDTPSNRNGYLSNTHGQFMSMPKAAIRPELGEFYGKGVKTLYTPETGLDVVTFGKFAMPRKIDIYQTDHLPKGNPWKLAQTGWLSLTDIERNTSKHRENALTYLNAYLLAYLPFFFRQHPETLFEYPETPSMFLGSIFVKTDPVLDQTYKMKAEKVGKKAIYPLSLLSFIEGLINYSSLKITKKNTANGLRDICAVHRRFFESVKGKYGDLDGYNIKINPIPKLKNVGYKIGSQSVKATFNLGYWVVFRIFIKELAKASTFIAAREVAKNLDPVESRKLTQLNDDLCKIEGFKHLKLVTYVPSKFSFNIPKSINIGGKELEIGEVSFPYWMHGRGKKIEVGKYKAKVDLPNYFDFNLTTVSAYAAQRSSNGANLCADTFDRDYIPSNAKDPATKHVPLRVRTDKVNVDGLESLIQEDAMMVLRHAKEIRKHFSNKAFVEPLAYQDNELSVHGSFRPLLQSTNSHRDTHVNLSPYVYMYEKWLKRHGIPFETELTLTPTNLQVDQFEVVRAHKLDDIAKVRLIEYKDMTTPVPFTALKPKTRLTPHSLRVQLVTVIKIITGDDEAVRLFTGQTDETIGFYTKASPQDAAALAKVGKELNESKDVASVADTAITEEILIKTLSSMDEGNKDLPFFAENGAALTALRQSGGMGLAINYTHICPYNNKCTKEVIALHGYMNCHECTHACITSHNKVAIAAAAVKALDEVKEYAGLMTVSTNESERKQFEAKYIEEVNIFSHWSARHNHILNHPDKFVIAGFDALQQYKYVPESQFLNGLLAKMEAVKGAPSLQSSSLKVVANMIAHQISMKVQQQTLPELQAETQAMLRFNPVNYVVSNLNMLAQLNDTTPEALLKDFESMDTNISLLEELQIG